MEIKSYAPGRVEWLGNHTDYNNGFVLAAALDVGTQISGHKTQDDRIKLTSIRYDEVYETRIKNISPVAEKHWANYPLGVVAELIKLGYQISGFEAVISGNVPIGAGLASSAALEISTVVFLKKLFNLDIDNISLAKIAQAAEHNYAGVKCGLLDQISSLMSKKGHATFIDFKDLTVRNIPVPSGYDLVIINSGVKHALVAGEYNERRASCESAAKALGKSSLRQATMQEVNSKKKLLGENLYKRAMHVVGENERVLTAIKALEMGDIRTVGELMTASHQSSKLYFENSCAELDFIVDQANKISSCLGSRLSGGGFGGATINLVESSYVADFGREIISKYEQKFGFEPVVFITKPSGGAK
ncbi:MAG: Galactokinase [bacterium ADurb.Bin212]|nr:MAG: Galactokinase [bacterium ADurb.Bin212]